MNIANINIEVNKRENGNFDVYIDTENSSGAQYYDITSDQIGKYVADLVECIDEAS